MDRTSEFYSRPSHEFRGGGFPIFSGSRRQRGGGFFGSLANFFKPIAKSLGRSLLSQGANLVTDVAKDAFMGRNLKTSIKNRGKKRAIEFGSNVAKQGLNAISSMIGKGGRRAPRKRRRKSIQRRRKRKTSRRSISRKPASRKRQARSKSTRKRNTKRRRIGTNF